MEIETIRDRMKTPFDDYFRLPTGANQLFLAEARHHGPGFFRVGSEIVCYGHSGGEVFATIDRAALYDASKDIRVDNGRLTLPFDPAEVVENLYRERYERHLQSALENFVMGHTWVRKLYYALRGILPTQARRRIQRLYFHDWRNRSFPVWPLDCTVDTLHREVLKLSMRGRGLDRIPFIWFWPDGASSCLIVTHDVETAAGRDFTPALMEIDESYGFRASFQIIPEKRYAINDAFVDAIRSRGFEFNIHDLNHDGHLYEEKGKFLDRAKRINHYVRQFDARGFRAGSMYRNADWYDAFDFSYDMSIPNVAHFEPRRGGCCTVMPFFIGKVVELPLTTIQDYSLFHILRSRSIDLWKTQVALILARNGLISFTTHPDYLIPRSERKTYETLLAYLQGMIAREKIWTPLPREVDKWWRARSQMELINDGGDWKIEGQGSERARIAYAVLQGDETVYQFA